MTKVSRELGQTVLAKRIWDTSDAAVEGLITIAQEEEPGLQKL